MPGENGRSLPPFFLDEALERGSPFFFFSKRGFLFYRLKLRRIRFLSPLAANGRGRGFGKRRFPLFPQALFSRCGCECDRNGFLFPLNAPRRATRLFLRP